jgi:hypothetical protein
VVFALLRIALSRSDSKLFILPASMKDMIIYILW